MGMNGGGGSAPGGGINFQAAVTAIVSIYIATGTKLGWLDGLVQDIPVAVSAETGGGGDDIGIQLQDESYIEIQAKKGLSVGNRLWPTLLKLAAAIQREEIDYGVLVVCPESSGTIRRDLAKDIRRIGDGRKDNLKSVSTKFLQKLQGNGIDEQSVCRRLRIVVLHCLHNDQNSVVTAQDKLEQWCLNRQDVGKAWNELYRDAATLIEYRGRRDVFSIERLLTSSGIQIKYSRSATVPLNIVKKYKIWAEKLYESYTIFGIDKPLSIDKAWISIKTIVYDPPDFREIDSETALENYQNWDERSPGDSKVVNPLTLGLYIRHCVIVGGPGMGKTTLLQKLFRVYTQKGEFTLFVRLPDLVRRINSSGCSCEEGIFALGLDGSGLISNVTVQMQTGEGTILLDGLDECGENQESLCQSLIRFQAGHSKYRIIISTRPVGYKTNLLTNWRHYELMPLDTTDTKHHLKSIVENALEEHVAKKKNVNEFIDAEITNNSLSDVIARNPQLLGLTAGLAIRRIPLGRNKIELYSKLFSLLDEAPKNRQISNNTPQPATLIQFLNVLGWVLINYPVDPISSILDNCSKILEEELSYPPLRVKEICDECQKYWEEVGILESLYYADDRSLTFIHKTFIEYAAARYLNQCSEKKQITYVSELVENEKGLEVLTFASSMGMADLICDYILTSFTIPKLGRNLLELLLEIIGKSENPPSRHVREKVFRLALEEVTSPDKWKSLSIASKLLPANRRFFDEVYPLFQPLLIHEQFWTKIAAWTFVSRSGTNKFDLQELISFLMLRPSEYLQGMRVSLAVGLRLGPGNSLLEELYSNAVRLILENFDEDESSRIIKDIIPSGKKNSLGFTKSIIKVLEECNREDLAKEFCKSFVSERPENILGGDWAETYVNYTKELLKILLEIDSDNNRKKDELRADDAILFAFSAFRDASNYEKQTYSSIMMADYSSENSVVAECFKGIIKAYKISLSELKQDAYTLLNDLESQGIMESYLSISRRTTEVDTNSDWTTGGLELNIHLLEKGLYSSSAWIAQMSGRLLVANIGKGDLLNICRQAIQTGKNYTLRIAAYMSQYLGEDLCNEIVLKRLQEPLVPGCQVLYELLLETLDESVPELEDIIRNGLLNSGPLTATEAVKLAGKFSDQNSTFLYRLLHDAYDYWLINEDPYPQEGGIIPPSPRGEILSVMLRIKEPSNEELLKYIADCRHEVRDLAKPILFNRLANDHALQDHFLVQIEDENISPRILSEAIKLNISFSEDQKENICQLMKHNEARIRFAAMDFLRAKYLPKEMIEKCLDRLSNDVEEEVRERVALLRFELR